MDLPIRDRLDPVGTVAGAFVVLLSLSILLTRPWRYTGEGAMMGLQIVGAVAALAIGVGLAYLAHVVE
ncbi:hypothetical protein [Halanaeroarchaeum sulfurireducens]|uniref:DUF8123 domain-containing protein n=1 Tax=Halanaeroarchaeum sulfurireducens TaxID=1604004 RepID=A0A0F7PBN7_9EURY|nr:hypothetical protein [Halanaeroarchaeum sulfurireducens]AKH96753.1 hypothetical protein HLASF_0243 [Halanaeroarchaeum sulfurireducens]ALG81155.1 hypothetical protein HLASA_0243 [Halanaeroarchaeum sulfurireducens]